MRKISIIFAMAAVALTSCVKETPIVEGGNDTDFTPSGVLVEKTFTASATGTKTYIDGEKTDAGKIVIKWCAGDEISVWDGVANRKFTMVGEPNGASATFKGQVDAAATEFYAIYPYSEELAYSTESGAKIFSVRKPGVQYANPDGGLADGAAYACGKADANGNIAFKNRSALLKFSIAEGLEVKSVTITGNADDDIIAGTLNFKCDDTHEFSVGYKNDDNRATSVKFCNEDGSNLKTGVDYYMALTGNIFDKGYTITLALADGKTLTRKSSKNIQFISGTIYPLASAPVSKSMFTYKAIYDAGEDIMIAGKAYNKETYGDGTLIAAGEIIDLIVGDMVYFVEPGAVSKIGPTDPTVKYIVIGNDPTQRTVVTQESAIKVGKDNAHYAFLNLDFNSTIAETTSDSVNDVLSIVNSGLVIDRIAYDNCHIELTGRYNIYNSNSTFKDIAYHNCDYVVTVTGHDVQLVKCDSSTSADYQSLDLRNNIFWHSSAFSSSSFAFNVVLGVNTNAVDNIVMKNNTFINLRTRKDNAHYFQINNTGSYIRGGTTYTVEGVVDSAIIEGNIIYINDENLTGNQLLLRASATAGSASNNYGYFANETEYAFQFAGKIAGATQSITTLTSSPFSKLEIDATNKTCDVLVVDDYKAYGAQR